MTTTLLVVDDDDEIRELLCDYLTDAGYNVLAAADGEQMREQLARHKVDLVVLDLMLPGEDGLSLCRQLQATRGLAVIMLSAKGSTIWPCSGPSATAVTQGQLASSTTGAT